MVVVGPRLVQTGLVAGDQPPALGQGCDDQVELTGQALVALQRGRNHVQHLVPHLVEHVEAQPAPLLEHALVDLQHHCLHDGEATAPARASRRRRWGPTTYLGSRAEAKPAR